MHRHRNSTSNIYVDLMLCHSIFVRNDHQYTIQMSRYCLHRCFSRLSEVIERMCIYVCWMCLSMASLAHIYYHYHLPQYFFFCRHSMLDILCTNTIRPFRIVKFSFCFFFLHSQKLKSVSISVYATIRQAIYVCTEWNINNVW